MMNSNYIDQLLIDSGLFPTEENPQSLINHFDFSNDVILITGAAGSVGSELTKQLLNCPYEKLVLVDIAESALYDLIKELEFENTNHINFHLLDITNPKPLRYLFEKYKPTLVFHTAAYKHVPLMEDHPHKAIELNILGTKLLADLAVKHEVSKFIFISTDKAVKPISVMGMSKRVAENYLTLLSYTCRTRFITTRFGNILSSNGSVLPLFKKQIEANTPLTVTDMNISRYFISKSTACSLILEIALSHHDKSNMFTFNMGEPIKIMDLAKRLVALYKRVNKHVEIKLTGIRPGEKLHEDMLSTQETLVPTENENILMVKSNRNDDIKNINFKSLELITPEMSSSEIKSVLKQYI